MGVGVMIASKDLYRPERISFDVLCPNNEASDLLIPLCKMPALHVGQGCSSRPGQSKGNRSRRHAGDRLSNSSTRAPVFVQNSED
jgi:hypothetical protein